MEDGEWGGTLDTEAGTLGRRPSAGRHVRRLSNTVVIVECICQVVVGHWRSLTS